MLRRVTYDKKMHTAIALAVVGCHLLLLGNYVIFDSNYFWFLPWNLLLAFVPLVFSWCLLYVLEERDWTNWFPVLLTVAWALFLPNSFYVISDFVHLKNAPIDQLLYQTALIGSFAITSLFFGLMSLASIHQKLNKKIGHSLAASIVGVLIFMCSFAVHLGREPRWNSWDVVTNPAGIIVDISNRIIYPTDHPSMLITTLSFFVMIGTTYIIYCSVRRRT